MRFAIRPIISFKTRLGYLFDRGMHNEQLSEYVCSSRLPEWSEGYYPSWKEICDEVAKDDTRSLKYSAVAIVLFFNKEDEPKLTRETLERICRKYMEENGMGDCRYICARHFSEGASHVHILSSRIGLDGQVHYPSAPLTAELMKKFDREEGLSTREEGEFRSLEYTRPLDGYVREIDYLVRDILRGADSEEEACRALEKNGIHPVPDGRTYSLLVMNPDEGVSRFECDIAGYLSGQRKERKSLQVQERLERLLLFDPFSSVVEESLSLEEDIAYKEEKRKLGW